MTACRPVWLVSAVNTNRRKVCLMAGEFLGFLQTEQLPPVQAGTSDEPSGRLDTSRVRQANLSPPETDGGAFAIANLLAGVSELRPSRLQDLFAKNTQLARRRVKHSLFVLDEF